MSKHILGKTIKKHIITHKVSGDPVATKINGQAHTREDNKKHIITDKVSGDPVATKFNEQAHTREDNKKHIITHKVSGDPVATKINGQAHTREDNQCKSIKKSNAWYGQQTINWILNHALTQRTYYWN